MSRQKKINLKKNLLNILYSILIILVSKEIMLINEIELNLSNKFNIQNIFILLNKITLKNDRYKIYIKYYKIKSKTVNSFLKHALKNFS